MPGVVDILPAETLQRLREAYDNNAMVKILSDTLPAAYGETFGYVHAIEAAFFDGVPPDWSPEERTRLSDGDRERVIIALLTAGDGGFFLALHVYIALMLWVQPAEVAHIILLAAIYSGVSNLAQGLGVLGATMTALAQYGASPEADLSCGAIYKLLKAKVPA